MAVIDEDIVTLFKEEQLLNAYSSMTITEFGISIVVSDWHPENAFREIVFTDDGRVILVSDKQLEKHSGLMVVI